MITPTDLDTIKRNLVQMIEKNKLNKPEENYKEFADRIIGRIRWAKEEKELEKILTKYFDDNLMKALIYLEYAKMNAFYE